MHIVVLLLASLSLADQQTPQQLPAAQASVQDRLVRVRNDLFSASPHLADDVRELKAILGTDPRSVEGHVLLGMAYRAQGTQELLAEAVAELRQAIEIDPAFGPARFYLAHIYLDLGRPARAKEELEAALEQAPGNPQFMASLGEAERQLKNPRKAAEITRRARDGDPTPVVGRYYLGLALFDSGQTTDA